jgi:DNA polymerase-4
MLADTIFAVGRELLAPEVDGTPFRLIGIGISALEDASRADPPDLIDQGRTRRAAAERAMDQLRGKYGKDAIGKGRGLKRQQDG